MQALNESLTGTVKEGSNWNSKSSFILYTLLNPCQEAGTVTDRKIILWKERSHTQHNKGKPMKMQCNCYTSMGGNGKASWDIQRDKQRQPGHKRKEKHFRKKSRGKECVKVWKRDIMVHAWKHHAVWYETHMLYMEDRWDGGRLLPEILKKETVKDQIRSPL